MRKFNKKIFLIAASVTMLLTFISWIAIWQDDNRIGLIRYGEYFDSWLT